MSRRRVEIEQCGNLFFCFYGIRKKHPYQGVRMLFCVQGLEADRDAQGRSTVSPSESPSRISI